MLVFFYDWKFKTLYQKLIDTSLLIPQPLYYAGVALFFSNRNDKAREYIDRLLKLNPSSIEGLALKGWIELNAGKDTKARNINQFFDRVLERCVSSVVHQERHT